MHRIGARDTICNVNFSVTVSLSSARRDRSVRLADRRRVEDGDARHASREFVKMVRALVRKRRARDARRWSTDRDPAVQHPRIPRRERR